MDDKTQRQLEYEDAVKECRKAVQALRDSGVDFSKRTVREEFKLNIVRMATKLSKDKRIFE